MRYLLVAPNECVGDSKLNEKQEKKHRRCDEGHEELEESWAGLPRGEVPVATPSCWSPPPLLAGTKVCSCVFQKSHATLQVPEKSKATRTCYENEFRMQTL